MTRPPPSPYPRDMIGYGRNLLASSFRTIPKIGTISTGPTFTPWNLGCQAKIVNFTKIIVDANIPEQRQ